MYNCIRDIIKTVSIHTPKQEKPYDTTAYVILLKTVSIHTAKQEKPYDTTAYVILLKTVSIHTPKQEKPDDTTAYVILLKKVSMLLKNNRRNHTKLKLTSCLSENEIRHFQYLYKQECG